MKKLFLSLLLCTFLVARPQDFSTSSNGGIALSSIYPEEVLEDLEILFATLKESHPDLYRYAGELRLEGIMDSLMLSMNAPKSEEEILNALQFLITSIGDPNLIIRPSDERSARIEESALMLPIKVKVYEEGLFVEDELKGHQSIAPGSRIFFINGKSDDEIMATLLKNIVAEGNNVTLKYRTIDRYFPELYYRFIDQRDVYQVMYEDPEGDLHSCTMHGLTPVEMELSTSHLPKAQMRIVQQFDDNTASGYLKVPSFDPEVLKSVGQHPEKEYRNFFSEMEERGYKMAVIDLRGNSGGTSYHAEQLYAWFAGQRFRADRDIWVASTEKPLYYQYTQQPEKFYKEIAIDYKRNLTGHYSINPDHFALNYSEPQKKAYSGRVYILIDGATRNSGAIPAILGKARERVILIGEESGANVFAATGGQKLDLTLPNTGIKLEIPLQKILFDVDIQQAPENGVLVDQYIEQHPYDLAKGKDSVLEAVHRLLMEYR